MGRTGKRIGAAFRRGLVTRDRSWAAVGVGAVVLTLWVVTGASCSALRGEAASDPRAAMYSVEPEVRVRVRKSTATARIDGPSKLVIRPTAGGRSRMLTSPVSVRAGITGLAFTDGRDTVEMGFGNDAEVVPYSPDAGASGRGSSLLRVDGVEQPGLLAVRSRSEDGPEKFDMIVVMPIEDYLPGVVVKEMYSTWPKTAFEMQAVCARTYALHERDRARRASRPFDLEATTLDQAYSGTTSIRAAKDAVSDTRGIVLTSGGQLIRAYFSSSCGGRAAAAADVWPTGPGFEFNRAAPLQGGVRPFACEPAPLYRWEVTRSEDELSQRFRAWGRSAGNPIKTMGHVRSVEQDRSSSSGRPSRYRVRDDKGATFGLSAEELRVACNQQADGLAPIVKETRVNSGDLTVDVKGSVVKIAGRGFGHGVGMCQWCTKGMADKGQTWRQMAATFYPGVKIVKAY